MKKNLILLASMIPLGINTLPLFVSCNNVPKIEDKSISWDFNRHGQYESRIQDKHLSDAVTQDQASEIYLKDLYEQPYILIDDYMVCLDTACYVIKQYGFTLDKATIDMEVDVTKDDTFGYFISLSNELHIEISHDGKQYYRFDGGANLKNFQYYVEFSQLENDLISPLLPQWKFQTILGLAYAQTYEVGSVKIWEQYLDTLSGLSWSAELWYDEANQETTRHKEISFDNTNYKEQTKENIDVLASSNMVILPYSKYFSKITNKEDFLLNIYKENTITTNEPITIITSKIYVVKIDLKDWAGTPTASTGLAIRCQGEAYDEEIIRMDGLSFVSLNNKLIPIASISSDKDLIGTPNVKGAVKGDIIITNFYFRPTHWNRTINDVDICVTLTNN